MLNDIELFNYKFRYPWGATDFETLETSLIDSTRGSMRGAFGAAVLDGLTVKYLSATSVRISLGIAVSPDGFLMYQEAQADVTVSLPASNLERALLVMRPRVIENTSVTSPTDPNTTFFLHQQQTYELVVVRGTTSATPDYPSKGATDCILAGLFLFSDGLHDDSDIDYAVREIPMKNATGIDAFGLYDDRLRPYKISNNTLGIKPSVKGEITNLGAVPTRSKSYGVSMVNTDTPSKFPRSALGDLKNTDATINFTTGVIAGGDELSPDFTPSIPTAGKFQLGLVQIDTNDLIVVKFASLPSYNTKALVMADIANQVVVPTDGTKLIAYVVLYSVAGSVVNDLAFFDARHPGDVVVNPASATKSGAVSTSAQTFEGDKTFNKNIYSLSNISADLSASAAAFTLNYQSSNNLFITSPITPIIQSLPTTGVKRGQTFTLFVEGATTTNTVTLKSSNGDTIDIIAGKGQITVMAFQNTPTTAAHWKVVDVYEEVTHSTTFTFNGTGGTSIARILSIIRTNKIVTVYFPASTATSGTSSSTFTSNTSIPSRLIPSSDVDWLFPAVENSSNLLDVGFMKLLNDGSMVFRKTLTGTTWGNSLAGSGFSRTSVSYGLTPQFAI